MVRLAGALSTLLIASVAVYSALYLIPGDPVLALTGGRRLTPAQIATLREQYGLDTGPVEGYFGWIAGVLRLDFGESLRFHTPVADLIGSRFAVSGPLMAYAAALTIGIGLAVAIVSVWRGGLADRIGLLVTGIASSTPPFVWAVLLLIVFSVGLGWFPAIGSGEGFVDRLHHLTMPAVALAISAFAALARIGRTSLLEELGREHVEVARSRGVPERLVLRRHVLRNALGPIVTLVALLLAGLFVGTAIVETAFGVEGVGSLLVQSVARRDLPVVQAISLCAVGLFVLTSILADVAMRVLDPRIAAGARS